MGDHDDNANDKAHRAFAVQLVRIVAGASFLSILAIVSLQPDNSAAVYALWGFSGVLPLMAGCAVTFGDPVRGHMFAWPFKLAFALGLFVFAISLAWLIAIYSIVACVIFLVVAFGVAGSAMAAEDRHKALEWQRKISEAEHKD